MVESAHEALTGGCHCGALSVRLSATRAPCELAARACTCTFCAPRRLRWTSDPKGRVDIEVTREADLSRYRFATGTADFFVCRRCGYVVAAVSQGETPRAVVNLDVLARRDDFPAAAPTELQDEDTDKRLARRARSWTPATVTVRR